MSIMFNSWDSVLRVFITVLIIYPILITGLKIAGKRSLSKMNPFDFIVTVAVGSIFGAIIIYESITIADGLVAISLLLGLQILILQLSVMWDWFADLIKPNPTLLYFDDEFQHDAMRSVRIARAEILAEFRQQGYICMDDIHAAVLETNGVISIIGNKSGTINQTTLEDVLPKTDLT